jgi:heme A synthase
MASAARWTVLAAVAVSVWVGPSAVSARHDLWSSAPDSTVDESTGTTTAPTTPEPSTPEPTTPESTPDTSEPDSSTSAVPGDDALIGSGDPDSDVDSTTAAIAVVGFVLLVALAGWWMVRRDDPDAEPMPPDHDRADPPSDLI